MKNAQNITGFFGSVICVFICLCAAVYVGLGDVTQDGLGMLFLLPLCFSLTIFVFWTEYYYCANSFGLVILYASSFVRYVISPVLIVASNSVVSTIKARASDYHYAIFVEIFELFVVMIAIRLIWPHHLRKKQKVMETAFGDESISFRLTWTGFVFIIALVALVILRGHWGNIISHLSTWLVRVDNREDLFSYDMMAFDIIKTTIFILVVAAMKRIYDRTSFKVFPFIIAVVAGLANTMVYIYDERTDLAVLIITSFYVLKYAFPKKKKFLNAVFGVGGIVLVAMVFMEGSMQYVVGNSISSVSLSNYSQMAQLYTTGPSVIANAHMNYDSIKSKMDFMTYAKDAVSSCDLFTTVPFLRFVWNWVKDGSSTVELYISSIGGLSYIIPNANLASLYVGDVLGWILEVFFIYWNIKLLGFFERIMSKFGSLLQVYAGISIVTMVAMGIFGNNFQLMLHSFSSLPLWLLIFSYINEWGGKIKLRK